MRYEQEIGVVCDACGAKASSKREVAVIGGQELGRVHHPAGWRGQLVHPAVQLAAPPAGGVDPFGPPPIVAAQIGQPVEALLCPLCQRKAEQDSRRVVLTGLPREGVSVGIREAPAAVEAPEVDEPAVSDTPPEVA